MSVWDRWPDEPPHRWQREAFDAVIASLRTSPGLVVAPTGTGKSRLQEAILLHVLSTLRPGWCVIVTVPRQALVVQMVEGLEGVLGAGQVTPYYGRAKALGRVIVCCQASMPRLADTLIADGTRVALWMADEAHRADTTHILQSVERLRPYARLGVTATPYRAQVDRPLRGWVRVAYRYTFDQAIEEGVLVPWDPVYGTTEERGMPLDDAVVSMIRRAAPPGPGLVSAVNIEHADALAAKLTAAGIPAVSVHSRTPGGHDEIQRRRRDLMAGHYRAIVHVDMMTEGVDIPGLRWLCAAAARSSDVALVQELGRVLRRLRRPDRWGDKGRAIVLVPRPTGSFALIQALARDPNFTASTAARVLQQRAEDEIDGVDAARSDVKPESSTPEMDPAEAAAAVGTWARALLAAVRAEGVEVPLAEPMTAEERQAPIRQGQRVALRTYAEQSGRRHPARYLPDGHRQAIQALCTVPDGLTAGQADVVIRVLYALRTAALIHNRRHEHHPDPRVKYWQGVRRIECDLPALAVRAIAPPPRKGRTKRDRI